MGLSILCANLPVLSSWLDNLISGHNGIQIPTVDNNSRRSRNFSTQGDSRLKPSKNPTLNINSGQVDAESDSGSQTGILKTTAVTLDHSINKGEWPQARSHPEAQERYKW